MMHPIRSNFHSRPYTFTTFGCREYLQRIGMINEGELVIEPQRRRTVSIAAIQGRVAAYYRLPVIEMTSARRAREVARPRQVAMYLAKQLTPRSLPEIGRRFGGRDHTTVIHAVKQIEKLRAQDADMDADVRFLSRELAI